MKIACLAWGSLIWKPGELPVTGEWHADGPALPVEFCRIGDGGELATALCMNAAPVNVYWAGLADVSLPEAIAALRLREAIPDEREDGVGILLHPQSTPGMLSAWAQDRRLDAVIWTALPPRYQHQEGLIPSCDEALAHLASLKGEAAEHAFDYIRRVPAQFDTAYRQRLQALIDTSAEVA